MGWSYVEEPCRRCFHLLDAFGSSGGNLSHCLYRLQLRSLCLYAAVLNSAEERRCNSDEQDHDHYLYLRRTRHFLEPLSNGRRSRPKSDRTRPPCLCNTLAASPSVFRCQCLHPLLKHHVCQVCQRWPRNQKNTVPSNLRRHGQLQRPRRTRLSLMTQLQDTIRTVRRALRKRTAVSHCA